MCYLMIQISIAVDETPACICDLSAAIRFIPAEHDTLLLQMPSSFPLNTSSYSRFRVSILCLCTVKAELHLTDILR